MATAQPIAGDFLDSPDHSLLHRQIASDTSAPVKSLEIGASGDIIGAIPLFQTINPANLLYNGDFECWSGGTSSAPDGWSLTGASATVAQEGATIKLGTYSAKVTRSGTDCYIRTNPDMHVAKGIAYWVGRVVTYGCWVYATVASRVRIGFYDGVSYTYSSYHSGGSSWEWLTATITVDASATLLRAYCYVITGNTSGYFDGGIVVEGPCAYSFSPKTPEEANWADYSTVSSVAGWAATPTVVVYTKKLGKTIFVSYNITGTSNANSATFSVPYTAAAAPAAQYGSGYAVNNGGTAAIGLVAMTGGGTTIQTFKDMVGSNNWTTSGTKTVIGQFWYEST